LGDIRRIILWLLACSLVFYGAWEPYYVILILVSIGGKAHRALSRVLQERRQLLLGDALSEQAADAGRVPGVLVGRHVADRVPMLPQ